MGSVELLPSKRPARATGLHVLAALAPVLLASCSGEAGETVVKRDRAERLARDREDLAALVRRIDEAGGSDEVLAAIPPALAAADPLARWCPFDGWALTRDFLEAYVAWNEPLEGTPGYRALDFSDEGHAFRFVTSYADALEAHGVDFLLVAVPTRIHVYPDHLPGVPAREPFVGEGPGDVRFLQALAEAGVEVLDLWTPFAAARYDESGETDRLLLHDHDVHWTPRGVGLAADLVAARVREMPWFEPGPLAEGADFTIVRELESWRYEGATYPGYEPVEVLFERVLGPDGEPARYKDRDSSILVMGDSFVQYARREGASLLHLLVARLGQRLDVILAKGGRGIEWATLDRRRDDLAGKKLVVWVVSASLFADHGLKDVPLFHD